MKNEIKVLAIETSCDETAAAVITAAPYEITNRTKVRKYESTNRQPRILSNIVSSQVDLHAKTGGIVPEIASRAHMECILPVIEEALAKSNEKLKTNNGKLKEENLLEGITHVAVTNGPGLIGSLLVGFNAAKTIAYAKNLRLGSRHQSRLGRAQTEARRVPLIPINHIEGHIYSAFAESPNESTKFSKVQKYEITNVIPAKAGIHNSFPILALTVSGGHTSLTIMRDHGEYETIGETIDDAAGEAFDKVSKLLGLGYPGGPIVSKFASEFRNKANSLKLSAISFPRPLIDKPNFNFSFSGLKTAVLTAVNKLTSPTKLRIERNYEITNKNQLTTAQKQEICWAFEEAVVDVLVTKTLRAAKKYKPKAVILAGGVAANRRLREVLNLKLKTLNINFLPAAKNLCGDNAAMIGIAAYYHILKNDLGNWRTAKVDSNAALGEQALA